MKVSMQLDRRAFLMGAGLSVGAVAVTATVAWPVAAASASRETSPEAAPEAQWAVDHIFGAYPPYAHPIPFGRQIAPPVSLEVGTFDPFLMI